MALIELIIVTSELMIPFFLKLLIAESVLGWLNRMVFHDRPKGCLLCRTIGGCVVKSTSRPPC